MQPRVKHAASISLILVAFTAFSVSLAGIPVPPVGEYLQAFPDLAAFALRHPQEVAELIGYLMGDPALFEWVFQHFDELVHLFSDEAILSLITENDWILPLMRDLYTLDPGFFRELFLDQAQALELLNWLVDHPEYRDLLRLFPALIQQLIESGFDEAILTPHLQILTPFPYQPVTGAVPVNLTVYAPQGIRDVQVRWNSSAASGEVARWQDRAGLLSATWDTTPLPPGLYSLTAIAETGNGSQLREAITVTVAPTTQIRVVILAPAPDATVSDGLAIRARVTSTTPIARCYSTLRGTHIVYAFDLTGPDATDGYALDVDTGLIEDGPYTLTVVALDQTGGLNTSAITVHIQDVPAVTILTPSPDAVVNGAFLVSARVDSVDAVDRCYANLTGPAGNHSYLLVDLDLDGVYASTADTAVISNGVYTLTVTAADVDGSTGSVQVTVTVATVPALTIDAPIDGSPVYGSFLVQVTTASSRAVASCTAVLSNATFSSAYPLTPLGGGVYAGLIDSAAYADGSYTLTALVVDALGAQNTSQLTLTVDNVPSVTLLAPLDGAFGQGAFALRADVQSRHPVAQVVAMIDGVAAVNLTDTGGVYAVTVDSTLLAEGAHTVAVVAINDQGDRNATAHHTVRVDNQPETITFVNPANGSSFDADVSVTANISDYVDAVEWYVNNWLVATQSFGDAYTTTVTYTVDISNILFPPNVMVVNVRYTSALGHASTSANLVLYKT